MMRPLTMLSTMFLLAACGAPFRMTTEDPRPNVAIPPTTLSIKLVLGPGVEDTVVVPNQNNILGGTVSGWHATLRNGFRNAFSSAFDIVPPDAEADLTLVLDAATPELLPTAVRGDGAVMAGTAHLRYRVFLKGVSTGAKAGTAAATKSTVRRDEISHVVRSAVEVMYEEIAAEVIAPAVAGAR